MNEDQIGVARRLVACKRWPDRADNNSGTLIGGGGRVVFRETFTGRQWLDVGWPTTPDEEWLPDLDDAATIGWLEDLVRRAWRDPSVYVAPCTELHADGTSPVWFVYTGRGRGPIGTGPTRAAALVAALEAAL